MALFVALPLGFVDFNLMLKFFNLEKQFLFVSVEFFFDLSFSRGFALTFSLFFSHETLLDFIIFTLSLPHVSVSPIHLRLSSYSLGLLLGKVKLLRLPIYSLLMPVYLFLSLFILSS